MSAYQFRYARNGYALASINYRVSGTAIFPAQIHDCKAAIRFLRANAAQYNLDPNRFAAWGSSAGGHLASLLGTSAEVADMEGTVGGNIEYSSRIQAVADWFGPTDFLQMDTQTAAQGCPNAGHNGPSSPESLLVGCPIQSCPQAVQRANPMTYLTPDDPPFFIQHGTADCTVPTGQSAILQNLMQTAGNDSVYLPIPGAVHGGFQFSTETNLLELDPFFESKLRQRVVANVTISGRVFTPDGRGLRGTSVRLTDSMGNIRSALTSSFGNYEISNVAPGPVYTITVASKRYRFTPRLFQVIANLTNVDLTGAE